VTSHSLLAIWVALEVNMLGFLAFIVFSDKGHLENTLIYLIIQALSSGGILFCLRASLSRYGGGLLMAGAPLLLGLKLGVAPLHLWLLVILEKTSWDTFLLLVSLQKIVPLFIIILLGGVYLKTAVLNLIVTTIRSISSCRPQLVLGHLSIASTSWPLIASRVWARLMYLGAYGGGALGLVILLGNRGTANSYGRGGGIARAGRMALALSFRLRLGRVPPFIGFWAKLLILSSL